MFLFESKALPTYGKEINSVAIKGRNDQSPHLNHNTIQLQYYKDT